METNTRPFPTCLWFDTQAEEAMNFYTSVFKSSDKGAVSRYGPNMPGPEGQVMMATFTLNGQQFLALNGGPHFKFNEAVSLVINCNSQEEVDYFWNALTADGGQESMCGWLKDKFGFSWQVTPVQMMEMHKSGNKEGINRMMQAMMQMRKLDLPTLQRAFDGQETAKAS